MKQLIPLLAVLLAGCFVRSPTAYDYADPSVSVTVDTFGPYLDPYGSWISVPGYGRVWQPAPEYVGNDFYPYGTGGRWVYTNAGWVFDSDYPFGWAVFHYGRWMRDTSYGWLWMPGTQWAPAWVSWRMGGPYVGWAPLGPRGAMGFGYRDWCFVQADRFTVRNVRAYASREYDFHRAVAVTQPVPRSGRYGPPPRVISQATGTRIDPRPINEVRNSRRSPVPPPPGRWSRDGEQRYYRTPPQDRAGRLAPRDEQFDSRRREGGQLMPPPPASRGNSAPQDGFDRETITPPPARARDPGMNAPPPTPVPPMRKSSPVPSFSPPPSFSRPPDRGGSMGAPPPPPMRKSSPAPSASPPPPPMRKMAPAPPPAPRR